MTRSCKVIVTCFTGREIRPENEICGIPPGPFIHAQNFPNAESVLDLMTLVCELEGKVDPGMACDTVIVNNDVGWARGNKYLASVNGMRTFGGHLRVVSRENYGTSLGGYNYAYEQFKERYDYWVFTEDDVLITGDQYLKRCVDTFHRHTKTGYVAILGLSEVFALHAHAGVGMTHVSVLNEVKRAWGSLPHRAQHESQTDDDHILWGEVMFTHLISRLGYRLIRVESDVPLYTGAYEFMMRERGGEVRTKRPKRVPGYLRQAARIFHRLADKIDQAS